MNGIRAELARKGLHIAMGGFALLLRWLTPLQAAACAAVALAFNLFLLHRITRQTLLRDDERARGFSRGVAIYPAAVLALLVAFWGRLELAAGAWGLLAFGDGMATVAGMTQGGPRLPWNQKKTWSGFLAFVLWGTAAAAFLVRWVQRGALEPGRDGSPVTWIGSSFLTTAAADGGFLWLLLGCAVAAVAAAFAESVRSGVDDNVLVPLVGGLVLWTAACVDPAALTAALPALTHAFVYGAAINALVAGAAYALRGVSPSGAIAGWFLGTALFAFAGWRGFVPLLTFFLLGTACTKLGWSRKAALGIAQERGGRRGAKNAVANVTAGVLFAFLAIATPYPEAFIAALVAAFATAASDTVASEIGQAFGRTTVLITTFRRVPPGTDGAISLEGTLAGLGASAVVAAVALGTGLIGVTTAGVVVAAAFFGTTLESLIGALLSRSEPVDNEVVNFANTIAGGLFAFAVTLVLR